MPHRKYFRMVSKLLTVGGLAVLVTLAACGGGGRTVAPVMPATAATPTMPTVPTVGTDVATFKNDVQRTGQNFTESVLTTSNVSTTTFGLLRNLQVDGKVDAQPLYLSKLMVAGASHNVVFIATENDSVYGIDADSGATLWMVTLLAAARPPVTPTAAAR
jgi:hypothetical protein